MPRKRWIWLAVLAFVIIVGAGVAWSSRGQVAYARIATGFAAKQTCSCLHVSGRALDSCLNDFPADARRALTVTQNGEHVSASVLFGAISAEAIYEDGYGCRLAD